MEHIFLVIESLEVKNSETGWYVEAIEKNGIKHTEWVGKGLSKELLETAIIYRYFTHRYKGTMNVYKRFVEEVLGYFNSPTETMRGILYAYYYIESIPKRLPLPVSKKGIRKYFREANNFLICQLTDLFQKWKKEVYLPKTENRSIIKI